MKFFVLILSTLISGYPSFVLSQTPSSPSPNSPSNNPAQPPINPHLFPDNKKPCPYGQQTFSSGATTNIDGKKYKCMDGQWIKLETKPPK